MAQTQAQLLKAAKAQLAKTKARLQQEQDKQAILNASTQSSSVNTTTMAGITAASRGETGYVPPVDTDTYATKVLASGKTQAQIDALRNAYDTAAMIRDNYGSQGITSIVDPATGKVITKSSTGAVLGSPIQTPIGTPNPIVPKVVPKVEPKEISDATKDAFAMLTDLFNSYGLESLAGEIAGYMTQGFTASEALIKLKTNPSGAYAKRFAGNFTRVKNGLNAISEAEYINLESSYASTLKAYGLGNMVSVNRDDNYKTFANYIAGDISAVEFKDRVSTVVTRVQNADPSIKATLKSFYPEISDADLVGYFLNPKENLPKLQEKVTASEIGAAAVGAGAGITTNVNTATSLARYGVDQATAREGYSTIAGILPTAGKLGDIYGESGVKYGQAEGEAEVFMGRQDAATKRNRLASMERGSFSGSAGNAPGAYSTGYLKKSSTAGLI
jgi:hypothetical protein